MLEKFKENAPAILMALAVISGALFSEMLVNMGYKKARTEMMIQRLEYYKSLEGDHDGVRVETETWGRDTPH